MKKTLSIIFVLALILSFTLVTATLVAAQTTWYVDDDNCPGPGSGTVGDPFCTIQAAVSAAGLGDTIMVAAGTYSMGQIVISQDLTIIGASPKPVIGPIANLPANNNAGSEWILVSPNVTFNLRNVVLDGSTFVVQQAIRNHGSAIVDSVDFINIRSTTYHAMAIVSFGGTIPGGMGKDSHGSGGAASNVVVIGCTFQQIGRIGVLLKGTASTALITGCTYTGKGTGDWLDYGIEVGAGGTANIIGNTITNCFNSTTAWNSAGIFVSDAYGPGSSATITGNTLTGNTEGIAVGYIQPHHPSDFSMVTANYNNIFGNTAAGIDQIGNITIDGRCNWWGDASGPSGAGSGSGDIVSNNVNYTPWLTEAYVAQESVAPTTGGTAYFSADNGNIVGLHATPTPPSPPATLPYGMFEIQVCCIPSGSTVTLNITLPGPVPVGTKWWKYHSGLWYSLPIGSDNGDNIITVTLTDGVFPGDEDSIPGQITDPGGPGIPVVPEVPPSECAVCGPGEPCPVDVPPDCGTDTIGGSLLWSILGTTYIMGRAIGDVTEHIAGTLGCWVDELAVPTFGVIGAITEGLGGLLSGVGELVGISGIFDPLGEMLSAIGKVIEDVLTS